MLSSFFLANPERLAEKFAEIEAAKGHQEEEQQAKEAFLKAVEEDCKNIRAMGSASLKEAVKQNKEISQNKAERWSAGLKGLIEQKKAEAGRTKE